MSKAGGFKAQDLLRVDPLLVDRVRLAIMAALNATRGYLEFTEMLVTLELTRGNLAGHLRKLEEGGFIEVRKEFVDRKPKTSYRSTAKGKRELENYLLHIESMIKGLK
jgi:DNA-binding PadR family transcriptional regulator